jgi:hypothetical protein
MAEWNFVINKRVYDNSKLECLEGHRKFSIYKSDKNKKCNFTECGLNCNTRSRVTKYARCVSFTCKSELHNPDADCQAVCARQYKIEFCTTSRIAKYFYRGIHAVPDNEYSAKEHVTPSKYKLSTPLKNYIDSLIKLGLPAKRIYSDVLCNDNFREEHLPLLSWLQAYVNRERSANDDEWDSVSDALKSLIQSEDQCKPPNEPFLVGVDVDDSGNPIFGNGSDIDPYVIGATSLNLLKRLVLFQESNQQAMLHIDSTFKFTRNSYPLLVIGISDINRTFFLIGAFIVSQTVESIVKYCLSSLVECSYRYFPQLRSWKPDYVMSDADDAHRNAILDYFGSNIPFLNCFFHIKKNVKENTKNLDHDKYSGIMADVDFLHFSRSEVQYEERWLKVRSKWHNDAELRDFLLYFEANMILSVFNKWQCFWTPTGYAKTNNPIENFNGDIKKTYTDKKRLKMNDAIKVVGCIIRTESTIGETTQVAVKCKCAKRFKKIGKELYVKGMLEVVEETNGNFLVSKANSARIDGDGDINLEEIDEVQRAVVGDTCTCDSYYKFGYCVHLVAVEQHKGIGLGNVFVNRTVRRAWGVRRAGYRNRRGGEPGRTRIAAVIAEGNRPRGPRGRPRGSRGQRGRPRSSGPALSLE